MTGSVETLGQGIGVNAAAVEKWTVPLDLVRRLGRVADGGAGATLVETSMTGAQVEEVIVGGVSTARAANGRAVRKKASKRPRKKREWVGAVFKMAVLYL